LSATRFWASWSPAATTDRPRRGSSAQSVVGEPSIRTTSHSAHGTIGRVYSAFLTCRAHLGASGSRCIEHPDHLFDACGDGVGSQHRPVVAGKATDLPPEAPFNAGIPFQIDDLRVVATEAQTRRAMAAFQRLGHKHALRRAAAAKLQPSLVAVTSYSRGAAPGVDQDHPCAVREANPSRAQRWPPHGQATSSSHGPRSADTPDPLGAVTQAACAPR
jgi:hypothetical protein